MAELQLANSETAKVQDWSKFNPEAGKGIDGAAQNAWSKDTPRLQQSQNNDALLGQLTITENGKPLEKQVQGQVTKPIEPSVSVLPKVYDKPFNAEKIADQIEKACNEGGFFGAGTDENGIFSALKGLNEDQIKAVDDKFASKHGIKYAAKGQRWGLAEEFKDELSGADLKTAESILKTKNEVPAEARVAGKEVLKPGSNLVAGETNRVTFADGRKYDVYVPKNAQQPMPVIMVMHGASQKQDPADVRYMEKETSMNDVAEKQGFAVIYAHGEPRTRTAWDSGHFEQQTNSWMLDGKKNLMGGEAGFDDAKYLDNVFADVSKRINVDEKRIGIAGMSDGGRAAEQYALNRPGKFSALAIMHGTWMDGSPQPKKGSGTPIMFVHGESDKMLPYDQGKATWGVAGPTTEGRGISSVIASPWVPNTTESRPWQQVPAWKQANDCTGNPTVTKDNNMKVTEYSNAQCKAGEIKEYIIDGGNHAWQDWRNEGGWAVVGMPTRNTQFSDEMARFILSHKARRTLEK